jgi:hypothetical protein
MAVPSADFGYRSNPGLEDRLTGLSYDGVLGFLLLAAVGGGRFSIDTLWRQKASARSRTSG